MLPALAIAGRGRGRRACWASRARASDWLVARGARAAAARRPRRSPVPRRAATIAASLVFVAVLIWIYRADHGLPAGYAGMIDAAPAATDVLIVDRDRRAARDLDPGPGAPPVDDRDVGGLPHGLPARGRAAAVPRRRLGTVLRLDLALLGSMALVALILRLPMPRIDVRPLSATTFTRILTVTGILGVLYLIAGFGMHGLPNVADVYGTARRVQAPRSGASRAPGT